MATGGLEHVLTKSLLDWLLRGRTPLVSVDAATGQHQLTFSGRYRHVIALMGVLAIAIGAVGVYMVVKVSGPARLLVALVFGGLSLAIAYIVFDTFVVRIGCSDAGLTRQIAGRPPVLIPWARIARIDYSYMGNWFTFRTNDGLTVRISIYRDGLGTLDKFAGSALQASPAGRAPHLLYEKSRNPS